MQSKWESICAPLCLFLLSTFLLGGCRDNEKSAPAAASLAGFSELSEKILRHPADGYSVEDVADEGGIIRARIRFSRQPAGASELKRQTLNALSDLQTSIGKDYRLAVWAYSPETDQLLAMAFYSVLTEEYHYKTAEELQ